MSRLSAGEFDLSKRTTSALYDRAGASAWQLAPEHFASALRRSCAHRFGSDGPAADPEAVATYLDSLHLADLALACACRDGIPAAWDHFVRDVQPRIRAAAIAVAGTTGPDLADVLLADLYGTTTRDGERRSLFDYFHGRSRLTTWLRAVLAQRHVDAVRTERREVSIDAAAQEGGDGPEGPDAGRARAIELQLSSVQPLGGGESQAVLNADRRKVLSVFEHELTRAINALPPADRLRLAWYHVHGLTLAQIGRLSGEHESNVSRKLARTRAQLRDEVERALRERHGFRESDLRQCYDEAARHGSLDVATLLSRGSGDADRGADVGPEPGALSSKSKAHGPRPTAKGPQPKAQDLEFDAPSPRPAQNREAAPFKVQDQE